MGQLTSRQEIISTEVTEPGMRNWLCANIALRETSQAVAVVMHRKIAKMHKLMQRNTSSLALCVLNCSRRDELNNPSDRSWCQTCTSWKREIQTVSKPSYKNKINFSRLNSGQWPVNPYETARAFMPKAHRLYYKAAEFHEDLRFSLSFIENCREFDIPKSMCESLWQLRGKVKRKNSRMRLSRGDMERVISALLEFLDHLEIQDDALIERLETLRNGGLEDGSEGCIVM